MLLFLLFTREILNFVEASAGPGRRTVEPRQAKQGLGEAPQGMGEAKQGPKGGTKGE